MKWGLVLTIKHSGTSSSPHFLRRKEASHDQVSWPWQKVWGRRLLLVGKTRESLEKQLFKIIYMISPNVTLRYRANWILTFLIQVPILLLLFFLMKKLFIYVFLAALGLCCCARAFSSCGEQGLLFSCGVRASHCGVLSCCRAQALEHRLSSCGAWA